MALKHETRAKERIRKGLERYNQVLKQAVQRGVSEEDTSTIVQSMLVDLLGYDRFMDISGQYSVKGRWVDWAIKVNESLNFFVEVKRVGAKLRDRDLFQVISYSRQHDLEWAILSTGDVWHCHRVIAGQDAEEFFDIRVLDPAQPTEDKVDRLYLLSKEGFSTGAMQKEWREKECFRPDKLARIVLSDEILGAIRTVVHRENPGRRIDLNALREAVARGVIRGDISADVADSGKPLPVE